MFKKLFNHKKIFIGIIILLVIGFLVYRNYISGVKTKKVDFAKVIQGTLEEILTISGSIDADEQATLRFQTSGRLTWVGVKEGDYVKKYQSLASLDQRDVEKTLKKKLLSYMKERWNFEQGKDDKSIRGRELYQVPGLSDAERRVLEKAQFDLDSSVLDVEIAALAKEYSLLWSPIEGILTKVGSPYAGVNITPAQADFEIINPKTIYFSASADQSEVVKLKESMPGELSLDSYPEATFAGTIKNISFIPKTGETGTVYEVKFIFDNDNSDYKYRLGMAGDLSFVIKKKENILYIPSKFIKTKNDSVATPGNGKKYVTVKRNGKDEKAEVTTGMETDTSIEITSGVSVGETVYD